MKKIACYTSVITVLISIILILVVGINKKDNAKSHAWDL